MSRNAIGYSTAIAAVVFWSTTGVFLSYLGTHFKMEPLALAFWRNFLISATLVPAFLLANRRLLHIAPGKIGFYALFGFVLALLNYIWTLAVIDDGAAVATVLIYSSAGFTAIFARILYREKLGPAKIAAILFSLIGCVMVSNAYRAEMWRLNVAGVSAGLLSGVVFTGFSLFSKEASRREVNSWTSLVYSFVFGAIFTFAFSLIPGLPGSAGVAGLLSPNLPAKGWLVLIVLSLVPTLFGFWFYNMSMNYLPASTANLLATLEPPMTAVEAYVLLDERMTIIQIAGGLAILAAVVMVQFEKAELRATAAPLELPSSDHT